MMFMIASWVLLAGQKPRGAISFGSGGGAPSRGAVRSAGCCLVAFFLLDLRAMVAAGVEVEVLDCESGSSSECGEGGSMEENLWDGLSVAASSEARVLLLRER